MSSSPPSYNVWVDRTDAVTGPGLHALIIGVSDYTYLPEPGQFAQDGRVTLDLYKVSIPCTSAFRVARWLRDRYWHPDVKVKTVDLLLSPSAIEKTPQKNPPDNDDDTMRAALAAEAANVLRADTANVQQAVDTWYERCKDHPDDIALLYVCGHGIQWNKDDSLVLLEDFGENKKLFMRRTIDIGGTMEGMGGDDMPRTQLYFVDACQIRPPEHGRFKDAGDGVRLTVEYDTDEHRSAPIYFGAVSQTAAKGRVGPGTYFSQALVQCLEKDALEAPDDQSPEPVKRHWHTSVLGLPGKLQDAVTALAKKDHEKQAIVLGGLTRPAHFSASETAPTVTVVLDVDPDKAAMASQAELRDAETNKTIKGPEKCWERPLVIDGVPAGIYYLDLSATDGFKPPTPILVQALNRFRWQMTLNVKNP